jgi:hypothetical protein
MTGYAAAHLDEIEEISDGRCPSRPVRLHFGIRSLRHEYPPRALLGA